MEDKIKLLLDKFYKWYETSQFHVGRIDYVHPFTKEFVLNSSNSDLLEAISKFAKEGGGIQNGGHRTEPKLRKSVEEDIVEFRKYLLSIWEQDFDIVKWLNNTDFRGWGKGIKTIFLHRLYPDKYVPFNNKSIEGLKTLGLLPEKKRGATEGKTYLNCLNMFNKLIEFDSLKMNANKVDALMHYIIAINEGQKVVKELFSLSNSATDNQNSVENDMYPSYSEENFLKEVYITKEKYETLKKLLKNKKNVILQGAPGVGKTFVAKRLAYSIIGNMDTSRVKMVQFHQSYGYEDFIMGYRPSGSSFDIKHGPFYKFCKEAEKDEENLYFFIIDEINRGNLSKIFGELLMLIEKDKRKESICLMYSDEQFSVPPNVHIIGMMNTADRSLAIIDYALRRRFSFFDFEPAFEDEGFKEYQVQKNNEKFNSLILVIKKLNGDISKDNCLGEGFRIGHSYFCTDDSIDDIWLNSVINYEIIPLLKEYWFDEPDKISNWSEKLKLAIK